MTELDDVLAGLPDPADRTRPWHGDEPAYLAWWRAVASSDGLAVWRRVREHGLIRNYAEAVPSVEALDVLGGLGPLLEVGAGTGYWSRLLLDQGGDVLAVDLPDSQQGSWRLRRETWTTVLDGDHQAVVDHPERVPFVCLPPRPYGFVTEKLQLAEQRTVALLTDGPAQLVDVDPLYAELDRGGWKPVRRVATPRWPARFDDLTVWQR